MVVYAQTQPFDGSKPKPNWYKDNEYCAYHHIYGHDMNKCMKLKILVHDLIDQGKIVVDPTTRKSPNVNLGMYKNALPKHQGEASTSNAGQAHTTNNINYNNVPSTLR